MKAVNLYRPTCFLTNRFYSNTIQKAVDYYICVFTAVVKVYNLYLWLTIISVTYYDRFFTNCAQNHPSCHELLYILLYYTILFHMRMNIRLVYRDSLNIGCTYYNCNLVLIRRNVLLKQITFKCIIHILFEVNYIFSSVLYKKLVSEN